MVSKYIVKETEKKTEKSKRRKTKAKEKVKHKTIQSIYALIIWKLQLNKFKTVVKIIYIEETQITCVFLGLMFLHYYPYGNGFIFVSIFKTNINKV